MTLPFQSFVWYIFGAFNSWSRLPIFEVPPNHLNVQNANGIEFERLSYFYPSNFTNNSGAFQRQKNVAHLSVCGSVGNLATEFQWYFANENGAKIDQISTQSCAIKWKAPEQGTYTVTLFARQKGNVVFEFRRSIRFIDFWIVSIGDSYSSGEGNPDSAINETSTGKAGWISERCHRSKKSWPYKVYEKILHFTRNRFAVHFSYLSCSGASVDGGPLSILSQLDTIETIRKLHGRGPELLMLSAGANDAGFSLIINQLLQKRSLSASRINFRLLFVQHQLDRLARRLKEKIEPAQIIIPAYFQFANNEQGKLDTKCADLAQMTKRDLRFAENKILQRLNDLIQTKANEYGWTAVPEVTELFDRAGLCAKNPLIRTSADSIQLQGDSGGSLHPTEEAHAQIADLIFSKLNFRDFIPS